jgi:hypothetical protein
MVRPRFEPRTSGEQVRSAADGASVHVVTEIEPVSGALRSRYGKKYNDVQSSGPEPHLRGFMSQFRGTTASSHMRTCQPVFHV